MKTRFLLVVIVCFLTSAAGWTVIAQGKAASPLKQRWEYKTIEWNGPGWSLTEDFIHPVKSFGMLQRLQELGEQGWELATVTEAAKDPTGKSALVITRFYFKRLK